jgi:hypothetical protein
LPDSFELKAILRPSGDQGFDMSGTKAVKDTS